MATIRQKRVAKKIVEALQNGEDIRGGTLLKSVDYGTGLQRSPGRVLESEGVKEALNDLGFTEDGAKKVVQEIMYNKKVDANARLKATDQVFKVHGTYVKDGNEGVITNNFTQIIIHGASERKDA
jgi:Holliday junction resolvasome RuvABC DNA-binding subunit